MYYPYKYNLANLLEISEKLNMKIFAALFLAIFLVCYFVSNCSTIHPKPNIVDVKTGTGPGGLWKSRIQWKANWVKHWEVRTVWIPVWKKVWGPVEIKEWIPFPKPLPT